MSYRINLAPHGGRCRICGAPLLRPSPVDWVERWWWPIFVLSIIALVVLVLAYARPSWTG